MDLPRFTRAEVWAELDRHYGQMYGLMLKCFSLGYAEDVQEYLRREDMKCKYCGSEMGQGVEICERYNAPTPHWWARLEGIVHG
jgi:hypothetical protein